MPAYPREELEAMVERWLDTNRRCEEARDWRPLADLYTEDATYGWNIGPHEEFMAVGRDGRWSWQRDWFDVGNATATFIDMFKAGVLSEGMQQRFEQAASGELAPG